VHVSVESQVPLPQVALHAPQSIAHVRHVSVRLHV